MRNAWRAAILVAVLSSSCTASSDTSPPTGTTSPAVETATTTASTDPRSGLTNALVTSVIDGDTVEVRFRGRPLTVRLIGIDTPESMAPGEPVQCYSLEASAYTTDRLDGERVRLELDAERIDPFGRTLAYAWLGDELFNETLVREGYAIVTTFPPNVRYVDRFRAAQREARSESRGVWDECVQNDAV